MNNQALDRLYTERINSLAPYIRFEAGADEDLVQEGNIGAYQALKKKPSATDLYLKNRAKWQMIDSTRRGRCICRRNGYKRKNPIEIVHYDQLAFTTILEDRKLPLDDLVISKVCFDNLLTASTRHEKAFIRYKLQELSDVKIVKKLKLSWPRLKEMKRAIRLNLDQVLAN